MDISGSLKDPSIRARGLLITRRTLLAGAAGAALGPPARPAAAAVSIDVTQGTVQPMPIALPDFLGGNPSDVDVARNVTQVIAANLKRSGLFAPVDPAAFIERISDIDSVPRFADWRAINAQALVTGRMTRQTDGRLKSRVPPVGCVRRPAAHRPAIFHRARQLAAHRPHHLGRDLPASDRGDGLLRQPRGVRRRIRAEGAPDQAACDHGSGRRQRALPDARRRSRDHAAVLAFDAGDHLHGLRPERAAGVPAQHRDRPARDRRQFSQHDLRSALLARRPARDHEPAAGQQLQPLRARPALQGDDAADRHARDRHRAVLFAGRHAHLLRERSRRLASRSTS